MSTRIDIEVAQALLSQRAKEIAGLNREQRLDRERKVKEEAAIKAAVDKGAEAALRNGRQGTGQAIGGGGAASLDARVQRLGLRSGVPEYYTAPKAAAMARRGKSWLLAPSSAEFNAMTRGLAPFGFVQLPYSDSGPSQAYQEALFLPGAGPEGSNALTSSTAAKGATTVPYAYGADLFANTTIRTEPSSRACTLELMVKAPRPIVDYDYTPYSFTDVRSHRSLAIQCFTASGETMFSYVWGTHFWTFVTALSDSWEDSWLHSAIVQEPGSAPGTRDISIYVGGIRRIHAVGLSSTDASALKWTSLIESESFDVFVKTGYGNGSSTPGPIYDIPTFTHGIRFTPRALYTGPTYTPPASITKLA